MQMNLLKKEENYDYTNIAPGLTVGTYLTLICKVRRAPAREWGQRVRERSPQTSLSISLFTFQRARSAFPLSHLLLKLLSNVNIINNIVITAQTEF